MDLISSGEINSIDDISWEVRKPSKKWRKGMLLLMLWVIPRLFVKVRREMGNESKIVSFLDRVGRQVGETSLYELEIHQQLSYSTGLENITVIAIQASSHSGNGTAGDVDNTGKKFARNLMHIGNHEHQTLRRRESSAQKTTSKSTMESTSSTSFGLFHYTILLFKNIPAFEKS